jgi:hypothetical protein
MSVVNPPDAVTIAVSLTLALLMYGSNEYLHTILTKAVSETTNR